MKKLILIILLVVIFALGYLFIRNVKISDQSQASPSPSPTQETAIKVGAIMPLTGDASVYGLPNRNVFEVAVDEVNSAGGVNGRQIKLIVRDSGCNADTAKTVADELINQEKVQIILGDFCSSGTLAIVPAAEAAKVAVFSGAASSPKLTAISSYFFRDYPSDAFQGKVLAEVAYNTKHWKKIAFAQEQTDYGKAVYDAFTSNFESLGGKVVKREFTSNSTEFKALVVELKAQKADALFIDVQTPAMGEKILKEIQSLKWKIPLLVSDTVAGDPATVTNNKTVLEGALAAEFRPDPENAIFKHLLEAYKEKYGADLPYQGYGAAEYDQVFILRDGLKTAGNDGQAFADWSRTIKDWPGASGSVTIQSDGDRADGHVVEMIKSGKVELLIK